MKKVTPEHYEKALERIGRLRLAKVDVESDIDLGPPVMLRRIFRDDRITWEVLPGFIAKLTLHAIPENEPGVARARTFRYIPKEVPEKVVLEWLFCCGRYIVRGRFDAFS